MHRLQIKNTKHNITIAITKPQTALAAYIHGEMLKFNYFLRAIRGTEDYLEPLDTIISD